MIGPVRRLLANSPVPQVRSQPGTRPAADRRSRQANRALTRVEQRIEAAARRLIDRVPARRPFGRSLVRFGVFTAKQAWACVFGAVLLAAPLWYPDTAWPARNDAVTLAAVGIQALMIILRLESRREHDGVPGVRPAAADAAGAGVHAGGAVHLAGREHRHLGRCLVLP